MYYNVIFKILPLPYEIICKIYRLIPKPLNKKKKLKRITYNNGKKEKNKYNYHYYYH